MNPRISKLLSTCRAALLISSCLAGQQYVDADKVQPIDVRQDLDFSHCGYAENNRAIPEVRVVLRLNPPQGDATQRIQEAIDRVSALPKDGEGIRGAVLLGKGTFRVSGRLVLSADGVVLRGSGDDPEETTLLATGNSRRTLIEVCGRSDPTMLPGPRRLREQFVKPGATSVRLETAGGLNAGDQVFLTRECTPRWISAIGMDNFIGNFDRRLNWAEGSRELTWDRTLTAVDGNVISFDAPITSELDSRFGGTTLTAYRWPGRVRNVGVEHLRCVSEYDPSNPKDEEHSWIAIRVARARDVWVKHVTAKHFVSSAVMLRSTASRVTVADCRCLEPISEVGGLRRISFYNEGQLNLVRDCYAEQGRHDFAAGYCSAGPNAFVDCIADNPMSFSGSMESWACGALFDNVTIRGNALKLTNLRQYLQGSGWSASNCVLWNCEAAEFVVDSPPHSFNYIVGGGGTILGEAEVSSPFRQVRPRSLFEEQLKRRLRTQPPRPHKPDARAVLPPTPLGLGSTAQNDGARRTRTFEIRNGRFVCDGKAVWGGHFGTDVWGGSLISQVARKDNPCITRYAPGRDGHGLTDPLQGIIESMAASKRYLIAHRPGLWYDRRRDDHMWFSRMDGDVWGPFLEMPWSRSGLGQASDGLSRYDLKKFNPWYFGRLRTFLRLCDENGFLLVHEVYNNHNLLENASHWVDSPWRPSNCIQETGLVEPPPFDRLPPNSHRFSIHIADEFYDVSHPVRRDLHTRYIRKCLDNSLGLSNVLFTMGYQYSGDAGFVRFYLDVVRQWQEENDCQVMIALQTGKNVTDAVLADPEYAEMISVIDMRYWQYLQDGELYAPEAGVNRAYRELKISRDPAFRTGLPRTSFSLLYKQVEEYRRKHPEKAILCYTQGIGPLPILMAGGAYAVHQEDGMQTSPGNNSFDGFVAEHLADCLWRMSPNQEVLASPADDYCLCDKGQTYLIACRGADFGGVLLDAGKYRFRWYDDTGIPTESVGQIESADGGTTKIDRESDDSTLLLVARMPE